MALPSDPFAVLSYVSGPALLTNATTLLILSTSNRFGRAIDRSRALVKELSDPMTRNQLDAGMAQLELVQHSVRVITRALASLYTATAMLALATLTSVAGAVLGEVATGLTFEVIIIFAGVFGSAGFLAMVVGAAAMVFESGLVRQALAMEANGVIAMVNRAKAQAAAKAAASAEIR